MARQTTPRTRKYEPRTERPETYEARRPERRPPPRAAHAEPRLGPYEFSYSVMHGYTGEDRIV